MVSSLHTENQSNYLVERYDSNPISVKSTTCNDHSQSSLKSLKTKEIPAQRDKNDRPIEDWFRHRLLDFNCWRKKVNSTELIRKIQETQMRPSDALYLAVKAIELAPNQEKEAIRIDAAISLLHKNLDPQVALSDRLWLFEQTSKLFPHTIPEKVKAFAAEFLPNFTKHQEVFDAHISQLNNTGQIDLRTFSLFKTTSISELNASNLEQKEKEVSRLETEWAKRNKMTEHRMKAIIISNILRTTPRM
jgi:hypothetical protein